MATPLNPNNPSGAYVESGGALSTATPATVPGVPTPGPVGFVPAATDWVYNPPAPTSKTGTSAVMTSQPVRTLTQSNITKVSNQSNQIASVQAQLDEKYKELAEAVKKEKEAEAKKKAEAVKVATKDQTNATDKNGNRVFIGDPSINPGFKYDSALGQFSSGTAPTVPNYEAANAQIDKDLEEKRRVYAQIAAGGSPEEISTVNAIMSKYQVAAQELQKANQAIEGSLNVAGVRSGRARYATELQDSLFNEEHNNGLRRLQQLNSDRDFEIQKAKDAVRAGKYEEFNRIVSAMDQARQEKQALVKQQFDQATQLEDQAIKKSTEARASLKFKTEQAQIDAENIAPAVDSLAGEDDAGRVEFIRDTAEQYGMDPNVLLGAVEVYRQSKNQKVASSVTPNLQLYAKYKSEGGTLDLLPFLAELEKQQLLGKYAPVGKAGPNGGNNTNVVVGPKGEGVYASGFGKGLSITDPVFIVKDTINGLAKGQEFVSEYRNARLLNTAKGDQFAFSKLASQILRDQPSSVQSEFTGISTTAESIKRALMAAEAYVQKNGEDSLDSFTQKEQAYGRIIDMEKDPEFTELIAILGLAQAELRKTIFGQSLTGNEKISSEAFLTEYDKIVSGDTFASGVAKLKNILAFAESKRNSIISVGGLIELGQKVPEYGVTSIKVRNIKTGEEDTYEGDLTPEEAKEAGYEIIK